MKKKICIYTLIICFILPCLMMISGCKADLFYLHIRLNNKDAHYTQQYLTNNNFSSENISKVVNPKLYDNFSKNIPGKNDLIAPEGKTFAGWYLNSNCDADYYFNKENWDRIVLEKKQSESKSASIYAFWIDDDEISISFNLDSSMSYSNDYKNSLNIKNNSLRFVGTPIEILSSNLPTKDDIVFPEDKIFEGWYLNKQCTLDLNETNLINLMFSNVNINVYAKLSIKTSASVSICAYLYEEPFNTDFYSFKFKQEIFNEYGTGLDNSIITYNVWGEEFDKVNSFLLNLDQQIDKSIYEENYEFDCWKFVIWNNGTRSIVNFSQENWDSQIDENENNNVTIVAIWNKLS